jgi:hypothetical protein
MEKGIQTPMAQNIQTMWWIRTSRFSIKNSLSLGPAEGPAYEDLGQLGQDDPA